MLFESMEEYVTTIFEYEKVHDIYGSEIMFKKTLDEMVEKIAIKSKKWIKRQIYPNGLIDNPYYAKILKDTINIKSNPEIIIEELPYKRGKKYRVECKQINDKDVLNSYSDGKITFIEKKEYDGKLKRVTSINDYETYISTYYDVSENDVSENGTQFDARFDTQLKKIQYVEEELIHVHNNDYYADAMILRYILTYKNQNTDWRNYVINIEISNDSYGEKNNLIVTITTFLEKVKIYKYHYNAKPDIGCIIDSQNLW